MGKAASKALSVYKNKSFARFAKRARIPDADLWRAARLVNEGQIDADLGGGVIKQRIARAGEGKSGGSRSIILFKKDERAVFIYGFEKKDITNIGQSDLVAFRKLAEVILSCTDAEIAQRVLSGSLITVERPEGDANV
ncbi:MAG: type II toxin-antitoxin system RelE/ParE family toxin [Terracidiphilus sp.]